jgi:exodeoxyribonuclease VII large subunit
VLLKVYAQFHETFGFSWIVSDIDPTYTLGNMARRRQEIIRQLKSEGVFDLQRELRLPLFAQRIAVISAAGAAGYGDFVRQLQDNDYGFHFDIRLFPAVMQGEQVEPSIIEALERIYFEYSEHSENSENSALAAHPFDVVVIIRGGGATADLSGFDTLALAENVAQFPLPIITGIGHDRDECILDMVSHTRVKTPTAAAALLIDHLRQVLQRIEQAEATISQHVRQRIPYQQQHIQQLAMLIPTLAKRRISDERHRLEILHNRLPIAVERRLTAQKHLLDQLALRLKSLDPQLLLARGYSITLLNGKAVRNAADLHPGDVLETRLEHGTVWSEVRSER